MAAHNELGKAGEKEACEFLKANGYEVLATNWKNQRAEADIIAKKNDLLLIIEVKTRSTDYFGEPGEAVGKQKQRMMVKAAEAYLEINNLDIEVRYDIIAVIMNEKTKKLVYIEEAFYPYSSEIDE